MEAMMEKILRRYGRKIRIRRTKDTVHAFLQPVTGKSQSLIRVGISPLGVEQTKQFVYIGPREPELVLEDVLELEDRQYLVRRAEIIHGIDGPVYQWAMCEAKGDLDQWGMDMNGYPL